ncbi:uncharacterized protein LOC126834948 [Adelges cooleyi]|uniref:uncharacterized protein LOC126834948 n=1 Tax=Adelges cooleyi TaxID=133065 RepID=UPI00218028B4|nr:uncharacterized protein LOC126834948 [Adelges cooleyi]
MMLVLFAVATLVCDLVTAFSTEDTSREHNDLPFLGSIVGPVVDKNMNKIQIESLINAKSYEDKKFDVFLMSAGETDPFVLLKETEEIDPVETDSREEYSSGTTETPLDFTKIQSFSKSYYLGRLCLNQPGSTDFRSHLN